MQFVRRTGLFLLAFAVLLAACSRPPGAAAPASTQAPAQASASPASGGNAAKTPASGDLRQEALDLMSRGDHDGAAAKWSALTKREPTADNLNDLAFAYLQAGKWQQAIEAGENALKLNGEHPYALFNTGMAYLESGKPCNARNLLERAAVYQPDRYEPYLGLARAYVGSGDAALAGQAVARAAELAPGEARAKVQAVQAAAAAMRQGGLPADLAKSSRTALQDGDLKLYLYPESQPAGCLGRAYSLFAVAPDGRFSRLPVGPLTDRQDPWRLVRADLPGGRTGYWLQSPVQMAVYISPVSDWRLFTYQDGQLGQAVFLGPDEWGSKVFARAFISSQPRPAIEGDQITAERIHTASGATDMLTRLQLSADLRTAAVTAHQERAEGTITAVGEKIALELDPRDRVPEQYRQWSTPLKADARVLRDGKPVPLTDLRTGMHVRVTAGDGATTVEIDSK